MCQGNEDKLSQADKTTHMCLCTWARVTFKLVWDFYLLDEVLQEKACIAQNLWETAWCGLVGVCIRRGMVCLPDDKNNFSRSNIYGDISATVPAVGRGPKPDQSPPIESHSMSLYHHRETDKAPRLRQQKKLTLPNPCHTKRPALKGSLVGCIAHQTVNCSHSSVHRFLEDSMKRYRHVVIRIFLVFVLFVYTVSSG